MKIDAITGYFHRIKTHNKTGLFLDDNIASTIYRAGHC